MPPKKEKKEIKRIFDLDEEKPWWHYRQYSKEEQQKIDAFFIDFQNELKELINLTSFNLSFQLMCNQIGIYIHPLFSKDDSTQNIAKEQSSQQEIEKQTWVQIQNTKIDVCSLKIVFFLFSNFPDFTILKFANNSFGQEEVELIAKYSCDKENRKVQKLYFDWNPLSTELANSFLNQIGQSNIEYVILRSNNLQTQSIQNLCEGILANPTCVIKHLELYDNRINEQGLNLIAQMIDKYQKIEYLSLAKNNINSLQLILPIMSKIGAEILTEQQVEEIRQQEKEREEFLADAKKKKKKINEAELPVIPALQQLQNGQFGIVRNQQLKMINLAQNPFSDKDIEILNQIVDRMEDDAQLVLVHSGFEEKTKNQIKIKYKQKVLI